MDAGSRITQIDVCSTLVYDTGNSVACSVATLGTRHSDMQSVIIGKLPSMSCLLNRYTISFVFLTILNRMCGIPCHLPAASSILRTESEKGYGLDAESVLRELDVKQQEMRDLYVRLCTTSTTTGRKLGNHTNVRERISQL